MLTDGYTNDEMAFTSNVVAYLVEHLQSHGSHVADVLMGPKREGWFNSEAFVAINLKCDMDSGRSIAAYGEESYKTLLEKVSVKAAGAYSGRLPDIVGYRVPGSTDPIAIVIEQKLILDTDTADQVQKSLDELDGQLKAAKEMCPDAAALGVVYAGCISNATRLPSGLKAFFNFVQVRIQSCLPAARYEWVSGYDVVPVEGLTLITTTMPYRSSTVSLGIAARLLRSQQTQKYSE